MALVGLVATACDQYVDDRALRQAVLDLLRPAIPFDAHVWMLTDPATAVGCSPHAQIPSLDALPSTVRLKYLSSTNRWTSLSGGIAVSLASEPGVGAGDQAWRAFLRQEYGVADVASIAFIDEQGCWGFLELWRRGDVFSRTELDRLSQALEPVTAALHRAQIAAFAAAPAEQTDSGDPVVLLLAPDLEVRQQTPGVDACLRALLPTEDDRRPVPSAAYNVAAQLLAVEAGVDDHPPLSRVWLRPGRLVTLRAARLEHSAVAREESDIAVTIERCAPDERLALFCRVHGLSARESDVLRCLAEGDDTRTVAGRLFLSEYTVQDHLKSIFDKTGVRSRRALLARAGG
ncbi:helix-turn-helix transcriptional regulator [Kribbella sp. NBC_01245]|uniref:response regulator transcription factor n=1 Tax=Kribbella sp. NBC_01245 TaxID=2903578 RepID=UPI002E28E378|nr:helix-turn-helix transcriptional regulator [Kribbella sp. NBC_01245]